MFIEIDVQFAVIVDFVADVIIVLVGFVGLLLINSVGLFDSFVFCYRWFIVFVSRDFGVFSGFTVVYVGVFVI